MTERMTLDEALRESAKTHNPKNFAVKKKRGHPEQDEQATLFRWIRTFESDYPQLKHVRGSLNGMFLHPAVAKTAHEVGMRKGEWDVFIDLPKEVEVRGVRCFTVAGMYIEMKWGKNTLTVAQEAFRTDRQSTHEFRVCYSAREAAECVLGYLWGGDIPKQLVASLGNPLYFVPEDMAR